MPGSPFLPVEALLPSLRQALSDGRGAVLQAAPGAGKTTRVPLALLDEPWVRGGRILLLEPRRLAARAAARHMATLLGERVGGTVGYRMRHETVVSGATRIEVVTEGILTRMVQADPTLEGVGLVVFDEFHERSIHADLAITLAKQAWRARDDLRIVVMSATLDTAAVSRFLDDCPVVDVPGRVFPLDISYSPAASVGDAVESLGPGGDVLCFLPGAFEIRRAIDDLRARPVGRDADVLPLYGSLDADEQDRALQGSATASPGRELRRRIVVATNIAETSVTVPGITAVVDSGLHKVARYDADRGIDSLETERITADAADQRAGRAGRTAPGRVVRLWDSRDRLRPHREPEIHRVDLAAAVLDVITWGSDPRALDWFERPADDRIAAALSLLGRLGAVRNGVLTDIGRTMQTFPVHPRLARMLVAAGGARNVVQACAVLSERHLLPARAASTTSDLLSAIDRWQTLPAHVRAAADALVSSPRLALGEREFRRAVFAGYPDRIAQRRAPQSPRLLLSSGAGAVVSPESGVVEGEFLVALDVHASTRPNEPDARVRLASLVDREWLTPTSVERVHKFEPSSGRVRAVEVERYDALTLAERPVEADPEIRAQMLADAWIARGPRDEDAQLLRRLRFAGITADTSALVRKAALAAMSLDAVDLASALSFDERRTLDRNAPETIAVPSGRTAKLEYEEDGSVSASVKLQELFGLADTPTIGPRQEAVRLALLAPNGRPVQTTRDLRSFWNTTYAEVRKELRGRYPRHPWPEDPWKATPTHRTVKRRT